MSFKKAIWMIRARNLRKCLDLPTSNSAVRHYEAGNHIRPVEVKDGNEYLGYRFVTGDGDHMSVLKRQQRLARRTAEYFQLGMR